MPDTAVLESHPTPIRAYLEKGYSVIPIKQGSKKPAISSWKVYQSRQPTEAELETWAREKPDCNWAIVTGAISGVVVLDFDTDEAERLAKERGLPDTLTVRTPGGRHYYYAHPGKPVKSTVAHFEGMDIRADGAYVLAPPSRNKREKRYKFENGGLDRELAVLPDWVLANPTTKPSVELGKIFETIDSVPAKPHEYTRAAFTDELTKLFAAPKGDRNNQLNKSALSLGQIVATGELDHTSAEAALFACARAIGLGDDEIATTIKSGLTTGLQTPRWTEHSRFVLLSVEQLQDLPAPSWLVEGIIPQGALAVLYGDPGRGKSFIALDWACCVATGRSWLDRQVSSGPAVYVSAEGAAGYKKRIAAWEATNQTLAGIPLRFLQSPVAFRDEREVQAFTSAIKAAGLAQPALIVIDTLARCFGDGDENTAKDMNAFIQGMDALHAAFPSATVVVVHHSGKDGDKGARGSTALRGACDTELRIRGESGDASRMILSCKKQKDAEEFPAIQLKRVTVPLDDFGPGESSCVIESAKMGDGKWAPDTRAAPKSSNDQKALKALATAWTTGMTHKEWLEASKLSKGTFKNSRKRLVREGYVEHDKKANLYRVEDRSQLGSTDQ